MRRKTRSGLTTLLLMGWMGLSNLPLLGQAIIAPSGRTMFHRGTLMHSFLIVERATFQEGGQSTELTRYVMPVAVVYGFYPQWTVVAVQSYTSVDISRRMGTETRKTNLNGLPDAQLTVQYDGLYSRNSPGGLTRLSGVFGVRLPTGADRFSAGAAAYTAGLVFEKAVELNYVLTTDFQYTAATRNSQGVKMGNRARFDIVPAYFLITQSEPSSPSGWLRRLYHQVFHNGAYFILELNGTWQAHTNSGGDKVANTGGTTLSISPGVQYFLSDRFLVEFSAPIPVVKALNGTQLELDSTFLFGFRVLF